MRIEINAPYGFEIVGDMPRSVMNDDNSMFVRIDIKPKNYCVGQAPNPHQLLIYQCEQDKKDYPEFWWELFEVQELNNTWHDVGSAFGRFAPEYKYRRHPHAENIIKWHQCSDEDKKLWQMRKSSTVWQGVNPPDWFEDFEYRPKPKTIGFTLDSGERVEFPEPVRNPLYFGDTYWFVYPDKVASHTWLNDNDVCQQALKSGRVYLNQQDAQQALDAIKKLLSQADK